MKKKLITSALPYDVPHLGYYSLLCLLYAQFMIHYVCATDEYTAKAEKIFILVVRNPIF